MSFLDYFDETALRTCRTLIKTTPFIKFSRKIRKYFLYRENHSGSNNNNYK